MMLASSVTIALLANGPTMSMPVLPLVNSDRQPWVDGANSSQGR